MGFDEKVGKPNNENDFVDNAILYSLYKDSVDYLITNDYGLLKNASRIGLSDRALEIDDALDLFIKLFPERKKPHAPPALQEVPVSTIEVNEPLLDTLRGEYYDFVEWFKNISRKGRKAWIYRNNDGRLAAIMIYKLEEDPIEMGGNVFPAKKRMKICLLKSEAHGQKLGEKFLKMAFEFAIKNGIRDWYLTHFTKDADQLVSIIENYGFYRIGKTKKYGDDVYYKRIYAENNELEEKSPQELDSLLYPAYYDGIKVNKYIVPIQPKYHERLFIEQPRTMRLFEFDGEMIVEGNTITKAYLCHSIIKKIKPGDVLVFYQSGKTGGITCVGTVERIYTKQSNASDVQKLVGKRTVYTIAEIQEMTKTPTLVILFRWHFNIKKPISYKTLKKMGVIKGPLQSIIELKKDGYDQIKKIGEISLEMALS